MDSLLFWGVSHIGLFPQSEGLQFMKYGGKVSSVLCFHQRTLCTRLVHMDMVLNNMCEQKVSILVLKCVLIRQVSTVLMETS